MLTFNIDRMQLNDLSFFNELRNSCSEFLHDQREFSLYETETWFRTTSPKFFIVRLDHKRIAYIRTSKWEKDSVYIGMDVAPEFRGKKFARASYILFINWLFDTQNIETIRLEVLGTNEKARGLYESLGFKEVSFYPIDRKHGSTYSFIMELKKEDW